MFQKKITLIVRIPYLDEDFDVKLPMNCTSKQIINKFIRDGIIIKNKHYVLSIGNHIMHPNQSLIELSITSGSLLILSPSMFIEGSSDMVYDYKNTINHAQNFEEALNIKIRVMPNDEDYDMVIPNYYTAKQIIEAFIENKIIPNNQEYNLQIRNTDYPFSPNQSLIESNITSGSVLLLSPRMAAGGGGGITSGNMVYKIPNKLQLGKSEQAAIRISKEDLKQHMLKEGLFSNIKIKNIQINDIMIVDLEENSFNKHLKITRLSTHEQIISEESSTDWILIIP